MLCFSCFLACLPHRAMQSFLSMRGPAADEGKLLSERQLNSLPSFCPAQRSAADEREELLSGEVAELQRRCGEAEARQQEMAARLPEATTPLLRQIEAMQVVNFLLPVFCDLLQSGWVPTLKSLL